MTDLVSQSEKYEMQKKSEDKHQFKSHIVSYDEMHHYTTTIARLNRYLQTPEIKMCEKKFGEIHVDKIAGKCLNRNKSIFLDLDSSGNRKHPNDDDRTKCANNMIRFIEVRIEIK